ncbi:MAG TPA: hypothetical protein PK742_02995 [Chitinophagales bacterium]|nr:hypothetical protein [Chitinophagales bacterium]
MQLFTYSVGQKDASGLQPDQTGTRKISVIFYQLMAKPLYSKGELGAVKNDPALHQDAKLRNFSEMPEITTGDHLIAC